MAYSNWSPGAYWENKEQTDWNDARWSPTNIPWTAPVQPVVTGPVPPVPPVVTTPPVVTGPTAEELERARLEELRRRNASAVLNGLMGTYGLGALMGKIDAWLQQGYEPGAIEALIRNEPEYAARFPAMKQLQAQGRTMTESEYLGYEREMAAYESLYGLPKGMLSSRDMVTKLLVNGKSPQEVQENAIRAAASMYELPQEFRDTMRRYYGIDSGGLTAYFLDPTVATPLLQKQFVSAQIGMEAWQQQVNVGADIAEQLYQQGVTREKAEVGFGRVSDQKGFTGGAGETADQNTLIGANLSGDAAAQRKVTRIAGSRTARFAGGGGYAGSREGVLGVGGSST